MIIVRCGYSNYNNSNAKRDGVNETNYLKKDDSYYNILNSNWFTIQQDINKTLSIIAE